MNHCEKVDGIQQPDKETEDYVFNHMMLRIKDPKRSLEFYSKVMGMRMVKKLMHIELQFGTNAEFQHLNKPVINRRLFQQPVHQIN